MIACLTAVCEITVNYVKRKSINPEKKTKVDQE